MVEAGAEDFVSGGDRKDGNGEANEGDSGFEAGHSSDDREDDTRVFVVTDYCDVTPEVRSLTYWMKMRNNGFHNTKFVY